MEKENILKIVERALEIGESSKHYVSVAVSTSSKTFPVNVYIHCTDINGLPSGIDDRLFFTSVDSLELKADWIDHWEQRIREERQN